MKPLLGIVSVLVLLVGAVVGVGMLLPQEHVVSRSLSLAQPPAQIWRLISDPEGQVAWRSDLQRVETLPDDRGGVLIREVAKGGDVITYRTLTAEAPRRLVRQIADRDLPFGGTWTFQIASTAEGSTLTITERGEVYNPVFRFISRFIIGHAAHMEGYLADLAEVTGSAE